METVVVLAVLALIVGGVIAVGVAQHHARKRRREALLAKYQDAEVVDAILRKRIWQGETAEMLHDSLGTPQATDRKVMKSKVRETWKYGQTSATRFRLRITLEDGVVVGWDHKE